LVRRIVKICAIRKEYCESPAVQSFPSDQRIPSFILKQCQLIHLYLAHPIPGNRAINDWQPADSTAPRYKIRDIPFHIHHQITPIHSTGE
jgi:hypothetical protein